jgi:hypothetical protein
MSADNRDAVTELRQMLREAAARLALDPATIASPTPVAIIGRTRDGSLLRLDVSSYRPQELSL